MTSRDNCFKPRYPHLAEDAERFEGRVRVKICVVEQVLVRAHGSYPVRPGTSDAGPLGRGMRLQLPKAGADVAHVALRPELGTVDIPDPAFRIDEVRHAIREAEDPEDLVVPGDALSLVRHELERQAVVLGELEV